MYLDMNVFWIGLLILLLLTSSGNGENDGFSTPVRPNLSYSASELYALRDHQLCNRPPLFNSDIPDEVKPRKRGRAGGVKKRMRSRKHKPYLPSLIMGNVQSLNSKIDEICANVKYFHDYRTASILSFTETWLRTCHTDDLVNIDGFKLLRGDRTEDSGKKCGGGVCMYINEQWCHPNNASIKRYSCSENIEILTVNIRPYYLPREFSHVIVNTVYVPNRNVARPAAQELVNVLHELEASAPDAFILVNGDFNHCSLNKTSLQYHQHVTCPTRGTATLDLCYSKVKNAYTSIQLPKLGSADHNLVKLQPKYRPLVQRVRPRKITVQRWNDDAVRQLQGALECTDWNVFVDNCNDIHDLTETVSDYINFCTEVCIPTKQVKVYPNNKPWINKNIKNVINKKKQLFKSGNPDELKKVKNELKCAIKSEKAIYRKKIENHFTDNNLKRVWEGMRQMSGYSNSSSKSSQIPNCTVNYANDLNGFYNRFDKYDFSTERDDLRELLQNSDSEQVLVASEEEVRRLLSSVNSSKAAGPDNLKPRLLKTCSSQLSYIFTIIFNLSLSTRSIPNLWKKSCIIPVPKKSVISCMNDLRPVALTAVPMKLLERFFLNNFKSIVAPFLDPMQFAYQTGRSCEDALLFLLEKLYSHLERAKFGNSVRLVFFDFRSAFNTIQPHLLIEKLMKMNIPANFCLWIMDYLTNRTQYVKLSSEIRSDSLVSSTGTPQGTVFAPFLYTVYTSDCRSMSEECPIVKFADDTAMAGLIVKGDDGAFRRQLESFVNYCDENFLELNVSKTKEMLIDFRRMAPTPDPILIKGSVVERVSMYKYLGVMIDDKLSWSDQVDGILKKLNSRMFCFRKMARFNVRPEILKLFYNSVISGVWRYCLVCWGGNVSKTEKDRLDDVIRRAARVIGEDLEAVDSVYQSLLGRKLDRVWEETEHPLHVQLSGQSSLRGSGRLRLPPLNTNRHRDSFVPRAIKLFNERL